MIKKPNNQEGFILATVIIVMIALLIVTTAIVQLGLSNFKIARGYYYIQSAQMAADAGLDYSIAELNQDEDWAGTTSDVSLLDENIRIEFEVTVDDVSSNEKNVTSTGKIYYPASSTTPKESYTVINRLEGISQNTDIYSVATGVGGLFMQNNSRIVDGDVLVNGELSMQNNAQIGLTTNSVDVKVAHQNCPEPPDATYPQVCGSGNGQPITLTNNAHIYGTVRANNQTSGTGMSNPGLTSGAVTPAPLPTHDRDAQKAAIAVTRTGSSAGCSSGTRTWAANTKINGNVTVSGSCKVTIEGDAWITGNLNVSNNADLIIASSAGSTEPVVMVDGSTGVVLQNNTEILTNSSGTGMQLITYYSTASCSPDCSDVTGTNLNNSRSRITIEFKNNADAPETVLYARWTRVEMGNNGDIGALAGQTVNLINNGVVTFGTTVPGGGSGGKTWVPRNYHRVYE